MAPNPESFSEICELEAVTLEVSIWKIVSVVVMKVVVVAELVGERVLIYPIVVALGLLPDLAGTLR